MAPSGFLANGGSGTPSSLRCATISGSRMRQASASGSIAQAMANTRRRARTNGACTGFSDECRALCRAAMHVAFFVSARGESCEELFDEAARLGIAALAITDRYSLAGIVRAHEAAKVTGVRVGCRLDLRDGLSLLVYPMDRSAYA